MNKTNPLPQLFCCLLFTAYGSLPAQQLLFHEDPDCQRTEIPVPWEKYSSVMLASVLEYDFSRSPPVQKIRVRIKLQDKVALDEYGELRLDEGEEWYIQIEKPEGETIVVDPKLAVTITANETQRGGWERIVKGRTQTNTFRKLAIPNIEVGDILDVSIRMKLSNEEMFSLFTSISSVVLTQGHPVSTRKIRFRMPDFRTDKEIRLLFKSLNGAPKIVETDQGVYEFIDRYREPREPELWTISPRSYPTIKYGMLYVAPELLAMYQNNDQQLLQGLRIDELSSYVFSLLSVSEGKSVQLRKFLKKTKLSRANTPEEREKLLEEHFYLRRYFVRGDYHDFYILPYEVILRMGVSHEKQVWNYEDFPFLVSGELMSIGTTVGLPPLKIVMALPRSIPDLVQVLSPVELSLGYMLKETEGDTVYMFGVHPETNWGEINYMLEGGKAYYMDLALAETYLRNPPQALTISRSSETENRTQNRLSADLSQPGTARIQETYVVNGHAKDRFDYVLYGEDLLAPDRKHYGDILGSMGERAAPSPAELNKLNGHREDRIRSELEGDFGEVDLQEITVLQTGRHHESPELIFAWTFEAPGLVKKAGPNYIFEIGKLITSQILIEEEDRERTGDVYIEYARSYFHDIRVQLPEGYGVEGLDELNTLVDNAAGQFSVEARQEGTELLLSVRKIYKTHTVARENWEEMLEFLDAAHAFTQKKVLLRKN